MEAVLHVPVDPLRGSLRREELGVLHIGERLQLLLRKELDPAAAAPAEQMEAFGLQPLIHHRGQLLFDRRFFLWCLEKERHPEHVECLVQLRESAGRQEG